MEEYFRIRQEKLEKIKELGVDIYPYSFDKTHNFDEIIDKYKDLPEAEFESLTDEFRVAGRIITVRKMGKSSFVHLYDGTAKLQVYIRKDKVEELDYDVFKLLDIGDIVGVAGNLFRTRTGELTILVSKLTLLTKSFHPLPEKWHGLQDKELRYRQRYLDLIVNEDTRRIFNLRSDIIQQIRMFFYERGFKEVETPMMQPIAGGAAARPFVTHHNALDIPLFLRIAPELYLKRLLVGGMEKVFEINRNFRNEGVSQMHNPEFTMIEWYQLYIDYNDNINLTEELLSVLNEKFLENDTIEWDGKEISMKTPFARKRFMDLISEKSGVPVDDLWDEEKLKAHIQENMKEEECPPTYGKMLELMFDVYAEPSLVNPTFVTDYPVEISPLSKVSRKNKRETERFELFVGGMEIANGFSELNDPIDQRGRFEAQLVDREKGDDEATEMDHDFLNALEHGMPPASGEGVGIDRLVMLYTGARSIKEVILFPLLRTKA